MKSLRYTPRREVEEHATWQNQSRSSASVCHIKTHRMYPWLADSRVRSVGVSALGPTNSIAWQGVLAQLTDHFKFISSAESSHNKQLAKLANSVPQPFSKYELFEKGGSVEGIGNLLYEQMSGRVTHSNHILTALDRDIIPGLEQTESYLKERVSHIRGLTSDFDNDLAPGLENSKKSLGSLSSAINDWDANQGKVSHNTDPFIVDLATRKHLRHSLGEENYLRETTLNLEKSSQELEAVIVEAIQKALAKYNDLVSTEAAELAVMSQKVEQSILAGNLSTEWTFFAKRQYSLGVLIDPSTNARTLETTAYPGKDHVSTAPICDGWLEKKSKYLNNYATAFYIISPSRFLHEFRSNDLRVDSEPVFSLYLPECEIGSLSKESDTVHRFVLRGKEAGSSLHQEHDWTFRAKTRPEMLQWYSNIGRASDPAFQFKSIPTQSAKPTAVPGPVTSELEHEDEEQAPFRGPETIVVSQPAPRRPAAGRFHTGGFATPWAAAAAALDAQPADQQRESDAGRPATTSYGSAANSVPGTPATYAEHEEHLRQAATHSAAAHFLDKEILDSNAYLEYDKVHGTHSTLVGDEDFKPADADVSVSRSNSVNGDRASYRPRRSSSMAFRELPGSPASAQVPQNRQARTIKPPSRKATATYGDLSNLPLPSMTEVNEATTPEPYVSPYFPAPGEGTTSALPASRFSFGREPVNGQDTVVVQPYRASTTNSGANTPALRGQPRAPSRRMSLSDQILMGAISGSVDQGNTFGSGDGADSVQRDLEPNVSSVVGTHEDARSPYPAAQRFRVPRSRQGSLMSPTPDAAGEPLEAYDVAPHMRVGTQSNEARYKVGSRRGSRSASVIATPQESLEPSLFDRSALDSLSADSLAVKLNQPSTGEKARARRTPSRGASMDLGDGSASPSNPAFNPTQRHNFRKPPSRGSSLSVGNVLGGGGDGHGLLNTINETFEKDLAAALGNKAGDRHVPGDFPEESQQGVDA